MSASFFDGYLQPSGGCCTTAGVCRLLVALCEETFEAEHVELEFADGALIEMLGAVLHCWVPKTFTSMSSLAFVRSV